MSTMLSDLAGEVKGSVVIEIIDDSLSDPNSHFPMATT